MNLFTQNSPYYHLLKYLLFLLKHPVYTVVVFIGPYNIFCFSLRLFPSYAQNSYAHLCLKMVSPATEECVLSNRSFATTLSQLKMCDFSGETFKGFEVL